MPGISWKALFIVLVLAAPGCRESTPPERFDLVPFPHYDLVAYAGARLPAVLSVVVSQPTTPGGTASRCENRLTGMTLDFPGNHRYTATTERRLVCDDGRPDVVSVSMEVGTYALLDADGLRLDASSASVQGGVHRSYARVAGSSLAVYRQEAAAAGGLTTISEQSLAFEALH
jgi:hypothetical protein